MAVSITAAAGGGGGSTDPEQKRTFQEECAAFAERIRREGMARMAELYCASSARLSYREKDPRGWAEFKQQFADGSAEGHAMTLIGVQGGRTPFFERAEELARMTVPLLVVVGDEDESTLELALFLKRTVPRCGALMLPKTGHTINLEEPAKFNAALEEFLHAVEHGKWRERPTKEKYLLVPKEK
jgi:pimeloyl-ACP methyl ester carboxylesterase